ncbi:MAG: hypothetical protein CMN28_00465 [Salinisphaeraceae bacterium]|jgi:small multidrug resistance pump|nr:hypothetical protein [Salinisphaeraceae bacterium]
MLAFCLKVMTVGTAYAIWSGVGITVVCGLSAWLWGQRLDTAAMLGISLILAGVLVITLKSRATLV